MLHSQDLAAEPFLGEWINKNADTRGITRVSLKMADTGMMAQMWGKCHSADGNWGLVKAATAAPDQDGRLRVASLTHYTDKSGRQDRVEEEIFIPAPPRARSEAQGSLTAPRSIPPRFPSIQP